MIEERGGLIEVYKMSRGLSSVDFNKFYTPWTNHRVIIITTIIAVTMFMVLSS